MTDAGSRGLANAPLFLFSKEVPMPFSKALVVLSGGQDSTTALFWAKEQFEKIEAITFDYGQRHIIEVNKARKICDIFKIPHVVELLGIIKSIGDSRLLSISGDISEGHRARPDLPASFVPGRNLFFIIAAASYAYKKGIDNLVIGACQTDYSGYPDCRKNAIDALAIAIKLGMDWDNFRIYTPIMNLSKAETVKLCQSFNGCMIAMAHTITCYNGQEPPCGRCPACKIRGEGFLEAGVVDPLMPTETKE